MLGALLALLVAAAQAFDPNAQSYWIGYFSNSGQPFGLGDQANFYLDTRGTHQLLVITFVAEWSSCGACSVASAPEPGFYIEYQGLSSSLIPARATGAHVKAALEAMPNIDASSSHISVREASLDVDSLRSSAAFYVSMPAAMGVLSVYMDAAYDYSSHVSSGYMVPYYSVAQTNAGVVPEIDWCVNASDPRSSDPCCGIETWNLFAIPLPSEASLKTPMCHSVAGQFSMSIERGRNSSFYSDVACTAPLPDLGSMMPLSTASPGCNAGRMGTAPFTLYTLVMDGPLSDLDAALKQDSAMQGMDAAHYAWTAQFNEAGCGEAASSESPFLTGRALFDDRHFGHTLRASKTLHDFGIGLPWTAREYVGALNLVHSSNASSECAGALAPGTSYGADAMWSSGALAFTAVQDTMNAAATLPHIAFDYRVVNVLPVGTNLSVGYVVLPAGIGFGGSVVLTQDSSSSSLQTPSALTGETGRIGILATGGGTVNGATSTIYALQLSTAATSMAPKLAKSFVICTVTGWNGPQTEELSAQQLIDSTLVANDATQWTCTEFKDNMPTSPPTLAPTSAPSAPTIAPSAAPTWTPKEKRRWDFTDNRRWSGGILMDSAAGYAAISKPCALVLAGGSMESYAKLVNVTVPLNTGWSVEGWFRLGDTATFSLSYAVPGNDNCFLIRSGFPEHTETWTHVVIAVRPDNFIIMYIDGVIDNSRKYNDEFCGVSGGTLVFGNDQDAMLESGVFSVPNDATQAGPLEIANVKLHAKTLDSAEIAAYRRDNTGPTDDPTHIDTRIGWWDFCESSGRYAYNSVTAMPPAASNAFCPTGTFVYHSGSHCCNVNREKDTGNPLTYDMTSCEDDNFIVCPAGDVDGNCGNPNGSSSAWTVAGDIEIGAAGSADRWFATAPDAQAGLTLQGVARDYVELEGATFSGSTTFEFHVQFDAMINGTKLIDCGAGESTENVYIKLVKPTNKVYMLKLSVVRGDGSGADNDNVAHTVYVNVTSAIAVGTKYHIVWTIAPAKFKLYLNGVVFHKEAPSGDPSSSSSYADATPLGVPRSKCYLGKGNYATDQHFFAGSISLFRIFPDIAMGSWQVAQRYALVAPNSAPTSSSTANPLLWTNGFSSHFVQKFIDGEWGPAGSYFAYFNTPNCGGSPSAYHKAVQFERDLGLTTSMRYPSSRTTQCSDNNENTPSSIFHTGDGAGGSQRILKCGAFGTTECGAFGASVMPIATYPGGECAVAASSLKLRSAFYGVSSGHAAAPAVFDFDGDGDLDLLLGGLDGRAQLYENVGTTAIDFDGKVVDIIDADRFVAVPDSPPTPFSTIATLAVSAGSTSRFAVGDLNGDGLGDIAVGTKNGTVAIFLARATGYRTLGCISVVGDMKGTGASETQILAGHPFADHNACARAVYAEWGSQCVGATWNPNPDKDTTSYDFGACFAEFGASSAVSGADGGHLWRTCPFADVCAPADASCELVNTIAADWNGLGLYHQVFISPSVWTLTAASGRSAPALADLDDDGDLDLIVGEMDGTLSFFFNRGTAAQHDFSVEDPRGTLLWCALTDEPQWVRPYGNVATTVAGLESCRDQCTSGGYKYWGTECPMGADVHCQCSNAATLGETSKNGEALDIAKCTTGFGNPLSSHCSGPFTVGPYGLGAAWVSTVYATSTTVETTSAGTIAMAHPSFFDIDADGDLDLLVGSISAAFEAYENVGSSTSPIFDYSKTSSESEFATAVKALDSGFLGAAMGDFDEDGDLDILIGDWYGRVYLIEQTRNQVCHV